MSLFTIRTSSSPIVLGEPRISRVDADTAHAWGLTLTQWDDAPERDRAYWRENVTHAPNFNQESR